MRARSDEDARESDGTDAIAGAAPADAAAASATAAAILADLGDRSVVLVGMPGAGKSAIGRRLAMRLGLRFVDADVEIERAAGMTIPEIFAAHGEPCFRDGERRVIRRLLTEGPQVLATGGGAMMTPETADAVRESGVSVWLKADIDTLYGRVRRRTNRPLLAGPDQKERLARLLSDREPVYARSDITVVSGDSAHEDLVTEIVTALCDRATARTGWPQLAGAAGR